MRPFDREWALQPERNYSELCGLGGNFRNYAAWVGNFRNYAAWVGKFRNYAAQADIRHLDPR